MSQDGVSGAIEIRNSFTVYPKHFMSQNTSSQRAGVNLPKSCLLGKQVLNAHFLLFFKLYTFVQGKKRRVGYSSLHHSERNYWRTRLSHRKPWRT